MRCLRTYQRMAHIDHFCDRCTEYIQPGDFYEGYVYATEKHIVVIKYHVNPSCDFPEDPDTKFKDESNIVDGEFRGGLETKMAA